MAKKILLADDSLTIQKVVELTFSDSEYDLVCVSNGQRALDRVAENMPDLILADVVMPEKNGYEVCEAIKANPATARIPVVQLSGTFEPFDRERAERLGCDAIVSKPFDSQQLLRQVEALLERDMGDVPSTATMAIPTMTNPQPHPSEKASPERAPAEAGFSTEDFTGRIRVPAGIAGGPDLFEEEYGQGDVESAIAAFEKAHPEFTHVADGTAPPAASEDRVEPDDDAEAEPARDKLASWLKEEPDRPVAQPPVFPPAAPAPFWVPREAEPDLTPIPFGADDSGAWRPSSSSTSTSGSAHEPAPLRADEAPTQQIPLAAAFASLGRQGGMNDGDRITDDTRMPSAEERTAEIDLNETRAIFASEFMPQSSPETGPRDQGGPLDRGGPLVEAAPEEAVPMEAAAPETEAAPPEDEAPVSREIEVLAQTTSIGQLKEMLSSVSRGEGGLSDDELDRLASRVVERLSEKVVREIAWEVIPDVAELVIKQRIKELEAGVE